MWAIFVACKPQSLVRRRLLRQSHQQIKHMLCFTDVATILRRSKKKVCGNGTSFFSSEPFSPSSSWMRKVASARALSSCLHLRRNKGCNRFSMRISKLGPVRLVLTLCLCAYMRVSMHSPLGQRLVGLLHFLRQVSQVEFLAQGLNLTLIIGLKISHVSGVFLSQVLPQSWGREKRRGER